MASLTPSPIKDAHIGMPEGSPMYLDRGCLTVSFARTETADWMHAGGLPMRADEIRFLFAYDRWATRRVLNALGGLDPAVWARPDVVGERGLGSILVHQLGSSQRWRNLFEGSPTDESVKLELQPLLTVDELRARWEAEWVAVDAWLQTLTDAAVANLDEGVPVWQLLVHVVNHGTQHRSEAAALLTAEGRSPGELDLMDFADAQAGTGI